MGQEVASCSSIRSFALQQSPGQEMPPMPKLILPQALVSLFELFAPCNYSPCGLRFVYVVPRRRKIIKDKAKLFRYPRISVNHILMNLTLFALACSSTCSLSVEADIAFLQIVGVY